MDLFDNCRQFDSALQSARARNRFFYSRAITPAAAPLTTQAAGRLEQEGVFANPVVFPAVPPGQAIIRVSLMATHTEEQLRTALQKFVLVGKELQII